MQVNNGHNKQSVTVPPRHSFFNLRRVYANSPFLNAAALTKYRETMPSEESKLGDNTMVEKGNKDEKGETESKIVTRVATLSELFGQADGHDRCSMVTAFGMAFLSGCNQPAQLIIFGSILNAFNQSSTNDSIKMVSFLAVMYLVVAIQMFLTNFLQTACMSAAAGRQAKRLRCFYFQALLRQNVAFFDKEDQGALATSVMERTSVLQDGLGEKLALGVQFFSAFFASLAVSLYYVWQLALLMMGVLPVLVVMIGSIVQILQKSSEESTAAYSTAGSTAQQALGKSMLLHLMAFLLTILHV